MFAEVRIAAGREGHLRSLAPLALYPANSLFAEGYLTTRGESALATYQMIRDAGFAVERADGSLVPWEELADTKVTPAGRTFAAVTPSAGFGPLTVAVSV